MLDFKVVIADNTEQDVDEANDLIANQLSSEFSEVNKCWRREKIIYSLYNARPAKALALLDGSKHNTEDELIEIQRKSMRMFTPQELEKIFNIIVNDVLLYSKESLLLSDYQGHRLLYEELVNKKQSLFYKVVEGQLQQVLLNGALWETLGMTYENSYKGYEKNIRFIENILVKEFDNLDVLKAEKAIRSLRYLVEKEFVLTNKDVKRRLTPGINLYDLSDVAVNNYFELIKSVYQNKDSLGLCFDDVGMLLYPVLSYEIDNLYEEKEDSNCVAFERKSYFDHEVVKEMSEKSSYLRNSLANSILEHKSGDYLPDVIDMMKPLPAFSEILNCAGNVIVQRQVDSESGLVYYYDLFFEVSQDDESYITYYCSLNNMNYLFFD